MRRLSAVCLRGLSGAALDPAVILGAAEELRLEGIVCKRLDTALRRDAVAEAQPIARHETSPQPTCACSSR